MPTKIREKHPWTRTIRQLLLLGACVALIYWILAPTPKATFRTVSLTDLKGVWTTSHPQYQDRFLQFADNEVTFGWGAAGVGSYAIDQIENHPDEENTLVHIRYIDLAKTDYQLSFCYVDQGGGMIWMKNQKGIYWLRTSDDPQYDPQFK